MRVFDKAKWLAGAGFLAMTVASALAQWSPAGRDAKLGALLDQGLVRYQTPELTLRLVGASGTGAGVARMAGAGMTT